MPFVIGTICQREKHDLLTIRQRDIPHCCHNADTHGWAFTHSPTWAAHPRASR